MPNSISPNRRPVSYLEDRLVFNWLRKIAAERETDISVIIREATSAYFIQSEQPTSRSISFAEISSSKAADRANMNRWIAEEEMTPKQAQEYSASINGPVTVPDLASWIRRYGREQKRGRSK